MYRWTDPLAEDALFDDEDFLEDPFVFHTPDRRVAVSATVGATRTKPATTDFPFNTICHLGVMVKRALGMRTFTQPMTGTGTLIAPQVVLTAGHNLTRSL